MAQPQVLCELETPLTSGQTYSTIGVRGLVSAIGPGESVLIGYGSGSTQAVTVTNAIDPTQGSQTLAVTPFTANANYAAGALIADNTGSVVRVSGSVQTTPATGGLTDRSGTIAVGGTAQQAMAANTSRKYLLLVNPSTAAEQGIATAETLWFNFTATAVATQPSIPLEPGEKFLMEAGFVSTELVSIRAATTGHVFVAKEA